MCIRDSVVTLLGQEILRLVGELKIVTQLGDALVHVAQLDVCLLYTSDAADERSSVDLGGRRIIKKKNTEFLVAVSAL